MDTIPTLSARSNKSREIEPLFDDYPTLRRWRELLTSIPGIAETTAARILGELPNITEFRNVKAVATFAGLSVLKSGRDFDPAYGTP